MHSHELNFCMMVPHVSPQTIPSASAFAHADSRRAHAGHGRVEYHAGQFFRWRSVSGFGSGHRARACNSNSDGADILDIGGESTRPGATPVTAEEELRRILPVIEVLRGKLRIPMSVDTRRADVAEAALAAGAEILNDISALRMDPRLGEVARRARVPL